MERRARLEGRHEDRIAVCTFGDASSNHATATAAFNSAAWCAYQNLPAPVLFVCEDNGIGISVRTPANWIHRNFSNRPDLRYFYGDGLDLADAFDAASEAVAYVRERRRPAFLHLRTVRLLGHAGSDVEQLYRTKEEIEATEAMDPLRTTATLLVEGGWIAPADLIAWIDTLRERVRALGREASTRPMLSERQEIIRPLFRDEPERLRAAVPVADDATRLALHGGELPEASDRPRHLAMQINRALTDIFAGEPRALLFGEDVARKGGVYHVTADLVKKFGVGRVFNTMLDETSILGLAIGAGHAGLIPLPEIQYLAYLANAVDQLRGEAGSMQFFSNGQYQNPMVVRIAGLAYQKGFGGHFHNDNGIGQLLEIPGLLVATPSRGDDAARILRTMVAAARELGRVCVFLEPIALYMTKDLHEEGDNGWLTNYPAPSEHIPIGEVGVYGEGRDLCIASFANGLWMSLRVAKRLEAAGHRVRVIDLRWLSPLPSEAVAVHAQATGRLLIVDECRAHSGVAATLFTEVAERAPDVQIARLVAPDTYIPLGDAANRVLLQEDEIEAAALALLAPAEVA
jgi:2-oxoisovalerate dehydrogenase E1 component